MLKKPSHLVRKLLIVVGNKLLTKTHCPQCVTVKHCHQSYTWDSVSFADSFHPHYVFDLGNHGSIFSSHL